MKKIIFKIFVVLGVVGLVFSLTSCKEEDPRIYEGYIVDKIFDQGYTYTTTTRVNGVTHTHVHRVPDRWYIVIYKNERISKHRVSKSFYEMFTVGSYVTLLDNTEEDSNE